MFRNRWIYAIFLAWLAVSLGGCGSQHDVVGLKGKLTWDGQPVPDMIVQFAPAEGRASEGKTSADGTFEMCYGIDQMGVEPGEQRVTVQWCPPSEEPGVRPDPLAVKVLDDFKKNGPIAATIEKGQKEFEIKLPR